MLVVEQNDLITAGRILADAGLVSAFGHVSMRVGDDALLTPPQPLGRIAAEDCQRIAIDADTLPTGIPKEAWLHLAIYQQRPDVSAICRAQPPVTTALASAGVELVPLHGQGSFCGPEVPVFDEAQLVRDQARGQRLARALGEAPALILRGNGALTVGADVPRAVARMWVLEASAQLNATAAAAGTRRPLSAEEQHAWRATEDELLVRIWRHLAAEATD